MTKLEKVEDMKDFFAFLIKHHFIGYLNYALLRKMSRLVNDSSINSQFEQYEQECAVLFNTATFRDIIEMFRQYPDLKPSSAIGLPHIVFRLTKQWHSRQVSSWNAKLAKFPWSDSCSLDEVKNNCVLIIYAVLPSVLPAALKDLRDPAVLKELDDIGVTVIQLPQLLDGGRISFCTVLIIFIFLASAEIVKVTTTMGKSIPNLVCI